MKRYNQVRRELLFNQDGFRWDISKVGQLYSARLSLAKSKHHPIINSYYLKFSLNKLIKKRLYAVILQFFL